MQAPAPWASSIGCSGPSPLAASPSSQALSAIISTVKPPLFVLPGIAPGQAQPCSICAEPQAGLPTPLWPPYSGLSYLIQMNPLKLSTPQSCPHRPQAHTVMRPAKVGAPQQGPRPSPSFTGHPLFYTLCSLATQAPYLHLLPPSPSNPNHSSRPTLMSLLLITLCYS